MGRTIPSFRIASAMEEMEWKAFRNSLNIIQKEIMLPPIHFLDLHFAKIMYSYCNNKNIDFKYRSSVVIIL